MISIFKDEDIYNRPSPQRLDELKRKHEEELKSLGITEEEFQERERIRKEKEAALRKKEQRKTNIIIVCIFSLVCFVYITITVFTHNSIMAGILALVVGVLILIYLPFLLGYLIELFLQKKIEFNGWLVLASIVMSGVFGLYVGNSVYNACIYEYGDDDIVYITNEGYCYHKDPCCFELTGHNKRSVRYGSIKNRKRACEICCR